MRWLSRLLNFVPKDERDGLTLDRRAAWRICGRFPDAAGVFRAMPVLVPDGGMLYLEGGDHSDKIARFLASHQQTSEVRIAVGTIWPQPKVCHLPAERAGFAQLAHFAEQHATPEICVHLHVYRGEQVWTSWYDAFHADLYVSQQVPESAVRSFCETVGCEYEQYREAT